MILTHISHYETYAVISPLIRKAFDFLKNPDTVMLPRGRYEIDGEQVYAMVQKNPGHGRDEIKLESHRKYIDIHFALSDLESLAWKERFECCQIAKEYNTTGDSELYHDSPSLYFPLKKNEVAIFFPEDAHAPNIGGGEIDKIVVKVAV